MAEGGVLGRIRDISIAKKLYFAVGIMALLIAIELFTLWFSISTLSSVRAFVAGEGLWSKAQKDAVYHLRKYGRSYQEEDYQQFLEFMKVPLGDRKTRLELIKENPDLKVARQGFLEGRNHEQDIDGMINLFRRFYWVSYIKQAIAIWTEADEQITPLLAISEQLHKEINLPAPSTKKIDKLLYEVDAVNEKLTVLEDNFSYTLGEGSRWLENLVLSLLFIVALTVEITGLLLTISVSRTIQKGLNEIIRISKKIAKGDFTDRAKVFSGDEIGALANSFNTMADELAEGEERLETIFSHAPSAVIVIDSFGKIVRWNPKAEIIFGWKAGEVTGKFLHETIIPDQHRTAHREGIKHFHLTGEGRVLNKPIEITALNKKGIEFDVELSISLTNVKGKHFFIGFVRDITERKKAAEELNIYARKLEQSNESLEQFAYVASHDLQEPLRTITNFVRLLDEKQPANSDSTSRRYMNHVVNASNRMKALIRDMLYFSRIGKHHENKLVNCEKVLHDVLQDMDLLIKEKHAQIKAGFLPMVKSSETEIQQLFHNLINNAIKFHKPGVEPVIEIEAKKQINNTWLFSVKDNGIGIDEKYKDKIFVIFQRLHNQNEYPGTGIGLATCKKIVELNGGKIWVESQPEKGSVFYFTFPESK